MLKKNAEILAQQTPTEQSAVVEPVVEAPEGNIPKPDEGQTTPEPLQTNTVPAKEELNINTSVMNFKFEQEVEPTEQQTPQTPEAIIEFFKKKGFNLNTPEDIDPILNKAKEFDVKNEELEQTNNQYNSLKSLLATLPIEIATILSDFVNNKNYKETIASLATNTVDYSIPAKSYDKTELIKAYNPELAIEDIEELDTKTINSLYKNASIIHDAQREKMERESKATINSQVEVANNLHVSIDENLTQIKTKYPDIKATELSKIKEMMKTGLNAHIIDEHGRYKPNAHELIMFGTHGMEIIEKLKENLEKEYKRKINAEKSKVYEEVVLENLNDNIRKSASSGTSTKSMEQSIKDALPPFFKSQQ